jgi:regulator of protease activity HflC (stomatin/prohibitin superfamily)
MNSKAQILFGFAVFAGLFFLILSFSAFYVVDDGTRGIKKEWGQAIEISEPGLHFKMPFVQTVETVAIRTQTSKINTKAGSVDLQEVGVSASVNWRIDDAKLLHFYKTIGIDPTVIEEKYIVPKTNSAMKSALGKYKAETMIIARDSARATAMANIVADLKKFGIIIEDFTLDNIDLDPKLRQAVNDKQIAMQQKLKAETDLERIKIESQQSVAKAEAEAQSLAAQKNQVTDELLKLRQIEVEKMRAENEKIVAEKWDGRLPTTFAGQTMPLLNLK